MTGTRSALLDAAQARFATFGYAGTSIRDLAGDVGVRESSVYKHFSSKQAVLDAVLELAETRVADAATRLGVSVDDAEEALAVYADITPEHLSQLAEEFFDLCLHDPDLVAARRLLTLEQYRTPHAARLLREFLVVKPVTFQTELFAALIANGVFAPADPRAVALAFWGPIHALLTMAEDPDAEPDARELLALHLQHFRATHLSVVASTTAAPPAATRTPATASPTEEPS